MVSTLNSIISVFVTGSVTCYAGRQVWLIRTFDVPLGIKRVRYLNFLASANMCLTFVLFALHVDELFIWTSYVTYNFFYSVAVTCFVENVIVAAWTIVKTSPPKFLILYSHIFRYFEVGFMVPLSAFMVTNPCKLSGILFVANFIFLIVNILGLVGVAFGVLLKTLQGMIPEYREQKRDFAHLRKAQKKMIFLYTIIFSLHIPVIPECLRRIALYSRDPKPLLVPRNRRDPSGTFKLGLAIFLSVVIFFYIYHAHLSTPRRLRPSTGPKSANSRRTKSKPSAITSCSTPTKIQIRPHNPAIAVENLSITEQPFYRPLSNPFTDHSVTDQR
eukprot:446774_1